MQPFYTGTNQFFFQHGQQSRCRYIVYPQGSGLSQTSMRAFFERHGALLREYAERQGWDSSVNQMINSIRVCSYGTDAGRAVVIDIPHYLVDAQRGLLSIEGSLRTPHQGEERHRQLPDELHEDFRVFTKPLTDFNLPPMSTFSQYFIRDILPELGGSLRLVKKNEESIPLREGLGNNFVTLDLSGTQLQKLLVAPKQVWKRFLDVAAQKVQRAAGDTGETLPLPLLTSVGPLPNPAMPLPLFSELTRDLFMFPTAVPFTSLTITLYSFKSLVYCILSGIRDQALYDGLSQSLCNHGYTVTHQGASSCRSKKAAKPAAFTTNIGRAGIQDDPRSF